MYRTLLVAWMALFHFSFSAAQISFGAKAGINLANWTTEGHTTITALQGGGIVHFPLNQAASIQTELLYEGKGSGLSDFIPNNPMHFSLQYLTMNALFGYRVRGVTFMLGPYLSKFLDSKLEINGERTKYPEGLTPIDPWDWGLAGGVTLEIIPEFGFEVLYYFGFPKVVDIKFGDSNGQLLATLDDSMNRVLQIGVYYRVSR